MKNYSNVKRVLHIVSTMDRGGAETLIMNIYRNMNRSELQFDFVTHTNEKGDYDEEIISLGGNIHHVPSLGEAGPFQYIKDLKRIITSYPYIAIHSHTDYQSGFPSLAAKLCGIKKRVCHSHSNNWPKNNGIKERVTLKLLQILIKISATDFCSCSNEAAEFMYGKKMLKQSKVNILKNGLDINTFINPRNCRESLLEELNLPNEIKIIGHVGRFSESKNQIFILKVLKKILETDSNYIAILVGDGPLKKLVEKEAEALGIRENVRFLGVRSDISRLMKAFDVFLFPSLFEGFGIVALEAQCAGTPCVVSDIIPRTTDMNLNLMYFINLNADINSWVKAVKSEALKQRPNYEKIKNSFVKNGFSIQDNVPKWLALYLSDTQSNNNMQQIN